MHLTGLDRILNSALALYSKFGIRSITMDDLCRELGISKKTLYQHISDKNDLIKKVVDYDIRIQEQDTRKMYESDINAIDELMYVNRRIHENESVHNPAFYYDLKKYHPAVYAYWIDYKHKRMFEVIHKNLVKGVSEGLFRSDLDPAIIARLQMAMTEMMHTSAIINENGASTRKFFNEVFTYHIHGICNERGLAYFKRIQEEFNNQSA